MSSGWQNILAIVVAIPIAMESLLLTEFPQQELRIKVASGRVELKVGLASAGAEAQVAIITVGFTVTILAEMAP